MARRKLLTALIVILAVIIISGVVYSQTSPIAIDSGFAFNLPAYNTSIASDDVLYCDSFTWDADNATTFILENAYMNGGSPIMSYMVSVQNGNLTFSQLGKETTEFQLATFGGNVTTTIVGYHNAPTTVKVDGSDYAGYTYNQTTDTLTILTEGVDVVLTYSNTLTTDEVVGIAVALVVLFFSVSVALIIVFRRKHDE